MDLFGDPLSSASGGEEGDTSIDRYPKSRAAEMQASCLRITHAIYGHMAWLRAEYRAFVHTTFPSATWKGMDPGRCCIDSDRSDGPAEPRKHDTCEGDPCLARAAQRLPPPRGYPGPTGPRCANCRNEELIEAVAEQIKDARRDPAACEHIVPQPPRRLRSHVEIGVLLASRGHPPASVGRICKALSRAGIPHCEDYRETGRRAGTSGQGTPPPAYTCPRCRNPKSHKGHRRNDTCAEPPEDSTPARPQPAHRRSPWSLGSRRARLPAEAGPDFRPCPHYLTDTDSAAAAARDAMRALADSPTRYPGQDPDPDRHPPQTPSPAGAASCTSPGAPRVQRG